MASDGVIACAVNALRALCGSDWAPTEVFLPRAAPADREPYRSHFRAPVRFDQEIATIAFPGWDLSCGFPEPIRCCGPCWTTGSVT
jgi:hypothetical protein